MNKFYTIQGQNITINILATASSKQDSFGKIVGDRLKISVKKAPENGQATEYMKKFIAGSFGVSLKNVELIYGETSKEKAFKIKNPLMIPEKLKNLINLDDITN